MRITGGILGGRRIKAPGGDVRPTQDKVRAAVFSSLGERAVGARVLDLYAGSGAFGLEAWSRGASSVYWVEANKAVFRVLKGNVKDLCHGPGGESHCILRDAMRFLRSSNEANPFDLILADPPYDREGKFQRLENTLLALEEHPILAPNGILVFELSISEDAPSRDGWVLIKNKRYGGTRLVMYVRGTRLTG